MEVMAETGRKEAKMYPFCQSPKFNAIFLTTDYQAVTKNHLVFSADTMTI